jgi:sugar phosphate isomerase/epimerase
VTQPDSPRPLALAHLTVLGVSPPALFDLAAAAGYASVGLRTHPAAPGGIVYPLEQGQVLPWRRALADAGLRLNDIEFVPLTPQLRVADLAPMLARAGELGAQRLNVSGDDADTARLVDTFGAVCDLAAGSGLVVELEFMRFRTIGTLAQALAVVQAAARPNGRVLVDLLHLARSGGTPDDLRAAPAEWLGSVQVCDAPAADPGDAGAVAEAREGRLMPGDGALPLHAALAALPADAPLSVEVPSTRTLPGLDELGRARRAHDATLRVLKGS